MTSILWNEKRGFRILNVPPAKVSPHKGTRPKHFRTECKLGSQWDTNKK